MNGCEQIWNLVDDRIVAAVIRAIDATDVPVNLDREYFLGLRIDEL